MKLRSLLAVSFFAMIMMSAKEAQSIDGSIDHASEKKDIIAQKAFVKEVKTLEAMGIHPQRQGQRYEIKINQGRFFEPGSTVMSQQSENKLMMLAHWLEQFPSTVIHISTYSEQSIKDCLMQSDLGNDERMICQRGLEATRNELIANKVMVGVKDKHSIMASLKHKNQHHESDNDTRSGISYIRFNYVD